MKGLEEGNGNWEVSAMTVVSIKVKGRKRQAYGTGEASEPRFLELIWTQRYVILASATKECLVKFRHAKGFR